ncbi:MAG: penicillin-binding protein activator, partial [Candidatus Hydrogenedentes bacterium]|nr:penicillin-binding protein activator [Candidatus Hydrogenedentota bacterium]
MKPSVRQSFTRMGFLSAMALAAILAGCTTVGTLANDQPPETGKYMDSRQQSPISTVDIESSDIHSACAEVIGKLLATPLLAGQDNPPHFVIEPEAFKDDTKSQFNVNVLVDLLRSELLNAANGRVLLVGREYAEMVAIEQEMRNKTVGAEEASEVAPDRAAAPQAPSNLITSSTPARQLEKKVDLLPVDSGTTPVTAKTLGADYFLGGRITDVTHANAGKMLERYTQIAFEVVDAKTAQIVFCD